MFLSYVFNFVKNIILSVLLFMPSMIVQAQAADANVAADTAAASSHEDQYRAFNFPRWPESRQVIRERIPHAPPGPYMSSALSDFSFDETSFGHDSRWHGNRNDSKADSSGIAMQRFNPDTPWPGQTKSPVRWQPENGYNFVDSRNEKQPYQPMQYNPPQGYDYNRRSSDNWTNWPDRNWPDSDPGRRNSMNVQSR